MTETHTDSAGTKSGERSAQPTAGQLQEQAVYTYERAGVAEREGSVPLWLWAVVISLLIWGIYYLIAYWNAPVAPS